MKHKLYGYDKTLWKASELYESNSINLVSVLYEPNFYEAD